VTVNLVEQGRTYLVLLADTAADDRLLARVAAFVRAGDTGVRVTTLLESAEMVEAGGWEAGCAAAPGTFDELEGE
jgi:hypothetical protein